MANALLGSLIDIIPAIVPLDLQTQRTGDVMSTKGMARFGVLVFKGAGTAGDDPVLSFKQATDVAGATNKDLAVITEYWSKQGTLTSVGTWTRVTQAASATVTLDATSAESQGLYYFEIETDQLDTDNGYDCFYLSVADTGIGMSEEFIRSKLFRPFQTTKETGMGIGAFESFQYVQELGGKIEVASALGQGTRITISLPLLLTQEGQGLGMVDAA